MTLVVEQAEKILRARLGAPVKQPTDYVVGFVVPSGKVLAMDRRASETRLWFQPPAPPTLEGVRQIPVANGNSNLDSGPLAPLKAPTTLRVEIDSAAALHRFIDWYLDPVSTATPSAATVSPKAFAGIFQRFQELVTAKSGHPFRGFDEGMAAVWEGYKPPLRGHALGLLQADTWSEAQVGTGSILACAIEAIEIQDNRSRLTNNLVFWQNRYGHANRDHRVLLEARSGGKLRREIEALLYRLYRGQGDDGEIFGALSDLSGEKYPLVAYLFFLKDMDRFMPIQPTGFDRAFRALSIDFTTLRQCHWQNYTQFNGILDELRPLIADAAKLKSVRLVDAHSFCWIFSSLLKEEEANGTVTKAAGGKGSGRIFGAREISIVEMCKSVEGTVRNANGQTVLRAIKNKELRMTSAELERLLATLLDLQGDRCPLTGIPFQFRSPGVDENLLPSVDRIDSNGHYEVGNLQIVCRFINFWKGDSKNEEFKRLLMLVRGEEVGE